MSQPTVSYVPTDDDRRNICLKFGCDSADVPSPLTLGQIADDFDGIQFAEMVGGYRITLEFDGRPALREAAAALLAVKESRLKPTNSDA